MLSVLGLVGLLCLGLGSAQDWELAWEDNFDFLNYNNWQHEVTMWGGGNNEFQVYTNDPANSYCEDGKLIIKPTLTRDSINPLTQRPFGEDYLWSGTMDLVAMYGACTQSDNWGCSREGQNGMLPAIMSARLRSYERFSFKYGKVEVIAKMPAGDYLWPAIWLLPEDWVYGAWPRSGEIDLNEGRGNRDLTHNGGSIGADHMASTLHWGPAWDQNRYYLTGAGKDDERNYVDYFHNYTMIWTANGLEFIIDGEKLLNVPEPLIPENPGWRGFWEYGAPYADGTTNPWEQPAEPLMAPFDQRFHFIVNIAVGGTNGYFPDDAVNRVDGEIRPKPWANNWEENQPENFWLNNRLWLDTWEEGKVNMEIDSIRVYRDVAK